MLTTSPMRILRFPETKNKTGCSRTTIWRGVKEGTFPAPLKIGKRAVGWLESDLDAWIEAKKQSVA